MYNYTNQQALSAIWKMYRAHTTSVGDGYRSGYNQLPSFLGNTTGVRTGNLLTKPNFSNNSRIVINTYSSLPVGGQYLNLVPLIASGWFELGQNPKTKYLQFKVPNTGNGTLQINPMKANTQGSRFVLTGPTGTLCIVSYYDIYDRECVSIGTSINNFSPTGNVSKLVSIYLVTTNTTALLFQIQHLLGFPYFDMNEKSSFALSFCKVGQTLMGSSATATYGTFANPSITRALGLNVANSTQYSVSTTQNPSVLPNISRITNNAQVTTPQVKSNFMMLQNNPNVLGVERNKFNPDIARAAEGWTPNSGFWTNWVN